MEHNLDDPITMMDFEHSGVEVVQEEMCLEDSVLTDSMGMDIEQEQPTVIEEGTEEVIVSDMIGDQFEYQEYTMPSENTSGANITIAANQLGELTTQSSQIIDMKYVEQPKSSSPSSSVPPELISIKTIQQRPIAKKSVASVPRQVAIAPKPTKGAPNVQYAIAPKPVTFMVNKGATGTKTISMKSVMQNLKGNPTVLAQIGKQLVMMPAGASGQKIKLASVIPSTSADSNNIQIVRDPTQLVSKGGKQVKAKYIIQGQSSTDSTYQPAVLTKLVPSTSAAPAQARYIMQQKTVPISIGGNKVILTSPSKQAGLKIAPKKQIISIKAELPKTTTSQANIQTKKIVITANPSTSQVKTIGAKTTTTTQGQRTQLHPINVPGKGIQYIKLVTNQPALQKTTSKPQTVTVGGKSFVLTDNKGNIIQMGADSNQPPPLVVTSNTTLSVKGKKLLRIAPVSSKSDTPIQSSKILQSLLVPREQPTVSSSVSVEEYNEVADQNSLTLGDSSMLQEETVIEEEHEEMDTETVSPVDVKPSLETLVSDAVGGGEAEPEPEQVEEEDQSNSVEVKFRHAPRKQEYFREDSNSVDSEAAGAAREHEESLIVVPPGNYLEDDHDDMAETKKLLSTSVTIEADGLPYMSSDIDKSYSDAMQFYESNKAMRPRKACNCTKSQCLKLYCDCFANGEFCNQCNCNNCHNNLNHEDTRQKAIRACLERNPNAFRPKIGKAKASGPEIVRRHNKGCNCKRSGCLKNYCECYEAKIACTLMCKCVGCRNIEETLERRRDAIRMRELLTDSVFRPPLPMGQVKQPSSFLTREVIEAVTQCMLATVTEEKQEDVDPVEEILVEFSRCMADIISASHQAL